MDLVQNIKSSQILPWFSESPSNSHALQMVVYHLRPPFCPFSMSGMADWSVIYPRTKSPAPQTQIQKTQHPPTHHPIRNIFTSSDQHRWRSPPTLQYNIFFRSINRPLQSIAWHLQTALLAHPGVLPTRYIKISPEKSILRQDNNQVAQSSSQPREKATLNVGVFVFHFYTPR